MWSSFPALNRATRNFGAAQLSGFLYAFGGYDYSQQVPSGANTSQVYDASGSPATPSATPPSSPTATPPAAANYNVCVSSGVALVPGTSLVPDSQCDDCYV